MRAVPVFLYGIINKSKVEIPELCVNLTNAGAYAATSAVRRLQPAAVNICVRGRDGPRGPTKTAGSLWLSRRYPSCSTTAKEVSHGQDCSSGSGADPGGRHRRVYFHHW